jgi:hypothetical protein
MRKNLLKFGMAVSCVFAAAAIVVSACNKSANPISGESAPISRAKDLATYAPIGAAHNAQLDSIYNVLKAQKGQQGLSIGKAVGIGDSMLVALMQKNNLGANVTTKLTSMFQAQKKTLGASKSAIKLLGEAGDTSLPQELYTDEQRQYLSSGLIKYLDKINDVIRRKKITIEQMEAALSNIETSAIEDLSDKDAAVLLTTTSVAKASMQYWHDNYVKWHMLSKSSGLKTNSIKLLDESETPPAGFWTTLGISDVAGAAGGAIYAHIMLVFGPPGAAGYGITVLATALSASLFYAVFHTLEGFTS